MWDLILLIGMISASYFVPKTYNDRIHEKYGCDVICWESALGCVSVLALGIFIHISISWVYWIGIALFVLLTLFCSIGSAVTATENGASKKEAAFAAIFQIVATFGVVIFLAVLLALYFNLTSKKKK